MPMQMHFCERIVIVAPMGLIPINDLLAEARAKGWRTVLILTALDLELQAVLAHLTDVTSVMGRDGTVFECGIFREAGQEWLAVLVETGAGNHEAQSAVTNAHMAIKPDLQIFVGVAGSRKKDVPIGSVVAASLVYRPYGGKYDESGFSARPRAFPANSRLLEVARKVRRDKKWTERITDLADRKLPALVHYPCAFPPLAEIAPAVSTEAVSANKASDLEALIASNYGDACIVEMEGYGSLFAAAREETPAIVIRGVSDMAEHKDPETDRVRQPVAAAHAAAFAFELIAWWTVLYPGVLALAAEKTTLNPGSPPLSGSTPTAFGSRANASGARYVINLDAEVGTVSAERIAAIEVLLRELTGDPGISIERIEEGSLRLIVRDPSAALEAIGPKKLRDELGSRFSLRLLGFVPEHSLEELKGIAEELRIASHDLVHWPDTLPDGEQFERPELQTLLALPIDRDCSVTAVIGDPGSGKSALLAMLGKRLIEDGHPVLAIKADLLDSDVISETDLQDRLGLSERPSSLLTRISSLQPTFLLIDQLDALAGYLDLRTGRLSVLLNLVRRLGKTANIHIVLSARKFEYEHDVRLRAISAESLQLQLPGWSDVLEVLQAKGIAAAGWPTDAQEVLRSPQALAIYLKLDEKVRSEPLLSYQSMLDRLWNERVLSGLDGAKRSRVAVELADQMAEEESLWLPRAKLDDMNVEIDALVAMDILTPNFAGSSVGFTHQTVFDYALARAFAKEKGRLSAFVLERQASIFCRPKVWAALTYLRAADPQGYEEEISLLWNAKGLRRHLRLLLIEFLGQQRSPTDAEENLILSAFALDEDRPLAFRGIMGSPGWFARFEGSIVTQAMIEEGPSRDWVVPILSAAVDFSPKEVIALIKRYWLILPENDYRSWSVLQQASVWSEAMLEAGTTILHRSKVAPIYLDLVAGTLGVEQPRTALLLVRSALDRLLTEAQQFGEAPSATQTSLPDSDAVGPALENVRNEQVQAIKNLLETSNEWDMLRALAERAPSDTIEILWPWFVNALDALASRRQETRVRPLYALQYDADFRFQGENGLDLSEPSIPAALRIAVEQLASHNPDLLRAWVSAASHLEYQPVHRLIAHALRSNPSAFAGEAFDYILSDERRWSLGHFEDHSATTTALVSAVTPFWTPEQITAYEQRIREYKPGVPPDLQNPDGRRSWSRILRNQRLRLLRALPVNRRTRGTADLVRSEERAIGDGRLGVTYSGVYSPASIMSADSMSRAKDDDILNAFKELPDATRWDHPSDHRKGGNVQLSREFATFAKTNPDRAVRLITRFEPAFGERGAGAAIAELGQVIDPELLQGLIVSLAQRGFGNVEFQASAATAIEALLSRDANLDSALLETMRAWLLADAKAPAEIEEEEQEDVPEMSAQNNDPEGRSLLWGYGGFSVLPGGAFPILHALVRHFLITKDHGALHALLRECLTLNFEQNVWAHLLPILRYLRPAEDADASAAIALIAAIIERFPDLAGTHNLAFLLAHIHWWAPQFVEDELSRWRQLDRRAARQGYGELIALMAFQHFGRDSLGTALVDIQRSDDADARTGAAMTAVNLWVKPACRKSTTGFLVGLIPQAGNAEWNAIFDLFRIVDELPPDESTALLLEAIADHAALAPIVSATFIVDRLVSLLPHEASLVARLAIALVENWRNDLGDIRTGTAAHASELVDLAVTLHRLGPATREDGTRLFERLLEFDAFEARATLDQIDGRFRSSPGARRPRLPRREREPRRKQRSF
jgi:nucleoside phosphorylase